MILVINGKRAALKKGTSFEYVRENRAFTGADDFSMAITLPLAGCSQNREIFGNITRLDHGSRLNKYEAMMYDRNFLKRGAVTVVEANEAEVKVQFLEGRSIENFDSSFDNLYINELKMPNYKDGLNGLDPGVSNYNADMVAMPWWNESENALNNEMVRNGDTIEWSDDVQKFIRGVSFMPYLIYVAKEVCRALGYTYDFTKWEESDDRWLLVCNTLPYVWDIRGMARALPHWTVSEFFNELEKILVCEFDIDHVSRTVSMAMTNEIEVEDSAIELDNIVDEFSAEMTYEDVNVQYKGIARYVYADRGDEPWKMEDCQWLIDLFKAEGKYYKEFDTFDEFYEWRDQLFGGRDKNSMATTAAAARGTDVGSIFFIKDVEQYLMFKVIKFNTTNGSHIYRLVDFNRFGATISPLGDKYEIKLKCLPARIDETDGEHGEMVFLSPSSYGEGAPDENGVIQPAAYNSFLRGSGGSSEYYSNIYLAYWQPGEVNEAGFQCPRVDSRFSLRRRYKDFMHGIIIKPEEKLKLSWLSTSIPNPRAMFLIHGQRYLCAKITATFDEDGMSQLLKGEFYPVVD